jgi:hypothetical protein
MCIYIHTIHKQVLFVENLFQRLFGFQDFQISFIENKTYVFLN